MLNHLINALLILFYCFVAFIFGILAGQSDQFLGYFKPMLQRAASAISDEKNRAIDDAITVWSDDKDRQHNGLLLLTSHYINNPAVILVDNAGEILHRWHIDKEIVNPKGVDRHFPSGKTIEDSVFGIDDAMVFPDGSVIFTQSIFEFDNYRTQRMARIDKDSHILWQLPGLFHHDMILAEDGNIYTAGSQLKSSMPVIDATRHDKVDYLHGIVSVVNPDTGALLRQFDIEEAFANSEYAHLLSTFTLDIAPQKIALRDGTILYDPIHLNSVDYITDMQARKLGFAEEGDLLISMRGNSTVAIVRPSENKVIWAVRGPWQHQHYVRLNDQGMIWIYDNDGGARIEMQEDGSSAYIRQPRVVEYDPRSGQSKLLFENRTERDLYSYWRGYYHQLDDNTMLVSSAETGRVVQVDRAGNLIWELRTTAERDAPLTLYTKKLPSVKYYDKDELTFLGCTDCADR